MKGSTTIPRGSRQLSKWKLTLKSIKIMKWILYQTINIVNNKIYIGVHKTENPDVFDGYLGCGVVATSPYSYNKKQTPFHCAVAKYGPSKFRRSVLAVFDNKIDAYKMEESIVTLDFIRRTDVYNACIGGFGGTKGLRPVYQFDLNGSLLKEWDTMQDVADFYCTSHTAVMHAVNYKTGYQNYFWSHEKQINLIEYKNYVGGTPVYKYDGTTGKFLTSYASMSEAAKANNLLIQQIQSAVKGGYKAGNYYFSKDVFDTYAGNSKLSIKNIPIYAYDLEGNFVKELNGSKEICEFLGTRFINAVTTAMRQKRIYKGYQLSVEKVEKMSPAIDKRNIKKPIVQYSLDGTFVKEFDSTTEAVRLYGTGVTRCLKGQQKYCHNFIFKYKS